MAKLYRWKVQTEIRPYVVGEDLTNILVTEGVSPEEGGMIARSVNGPQQYYMTAQFFADFYEEVPPVTG